MCNAGVEAGVVPESAKQLKRRSCACLGPCLVVFAAVLAVGITCRIVA
jgi:hypothetical protein